MLKNIYLIILICFFVSVVAGPTLAKDSRVLEGPFLKFGISSVSLMGGLFSGFSDYGHGQTVVYGIGYKKTIKSINDGADLQALLQIDRADYELSSINTISGFFMNYYFDLILSQLFYDNSSAYLGLGLGYIATNVDVQGENQSRFTLNIPIGLEFPLNQGNNAFRIGAEIFMGIFDGTKPTLFGGSIGVGYCWGL